MSKKGPPMECLTAEFFQFAAKIIKIIILNS